MGPKKGLKLGRLEEEAAVLAELLELIIRENFCLVFRAKVAKFMIQVALLARSGV